MADVNLDVGFNINQTQLSREINRAVSAAASVSKPVDLKLNSAGFTQPLGKISAQLNDFDRSLDAASARVLAFGASVAIINSVKNAFTSLVRETIKVKDELAEINVLLGLSASNLKTFSRDLFNTAKNTRQSFEQASKAAAEFSRQGLGAEETLRRTSDALKLTRISGLDAAKSVETLTASVNGFVNSAINTTEVVNKLANVDAAFAVSSADLAESLARAGSTAQDANISFEELLALTTAVQQQTARGGAVIGNAFKTIFARVSRQTSIDQLRELGVAIDQSQSGVEKLKAIGDALQDSSETTRNKIAEITGGVRQINIVSAAFRDLNREASIFDSALGIAVNSTNEADKRIEELNKTLGSLANESLLTVQELFSSIGDIGVEDNLKKLLQSFNELFGGLTNLISGETVGSDIARSVIEGISNFITGPGLAIAAKVFIRLFTQVAKDSASAFKSITGITSEAQRQQAIQKTILSILDAQGGEYKSLILGAKTKAEQEKIVLDILNQQVKAQSILQKQSAAIASSPALKNFSVGRSGLVKNAADGILPSGSSLFGALIKEQEGISKGKGGASAGANPVLIPNFNFGQGQKGPLVVNTDEYIIKDFDGKGSSAVLTKDMVRALGGANVIKQLGGEKVPFAVEGNVPFNPANVRRSSGQIISNIELEKLNEAAKKYVEALSKGTEKAQNSAIKNLEKLSKSLNQDSIANVQKFISRKNIAQNFVIPSQGESFREELAKINERKGIGALTRAEENQIKAQAFSKIGKNQGIDLNIKNKFSAFQESQLQKQLIQDFQGGKFLNKQRQFDVEQLLKNQAFKNAGLSQAEINKILTNRDRLPDDIKKSVKQIEDAIRKRVQDQAKQVASNLIQREKARGIINLQEFETASKKGRIGRFIRRESISSLPEFQNLTNAQQREILSNRGIGGLSRRVGSSLGAGLRNPIGLSLATSFLAPVAENAATRADGTQNLAGAGVAGALQGASFGALLGPWGAAVGALAGGLTSLAEAADPAANSIIKLTNELDKQREVANKNQNALQQAIQQQSNIGQLISSGNGEAIRRNQEAFTNTIATLSGEGLQDDVRKIIVGAEGNTTEIVKGLEKILAEQQRANQIQDRVRTSGLSIATAEKENRGFFNIGGIFGETNISAKQLESVANDVSIAISSIIDDGKMEEVRQAFDNLSGEISDQNFINAFTSFAENSKEFKEFAEIATNSLRQLGDDRDLEQLVRLIDKRRKEREEAKKTSDGIVRFTESLTEATKRLSQTVGVVNKINEITRLQQSSDFASAQRNESLKTAFAQFSNPIAESLTFFAKEMRQIQNEENNQISDLSTQFRESFANLIQSNPQSFGREFDSLRTILTNPNFQLSGETLKLIESAINDSKNQDIKSYSKLIELTQNSLGELAKVSINTQEAKSIAEYQLRVAEARAAEEQRQKNINFLGGIESLLSGSQSFNRFRLRDSGDVTASGVIGDRISSRRALDIINFQQAFQPVGVNASSRDQERVLKEIVSSVANSFITATGGADIDKITKISQDIFDDFFKKNELTPENIASAIGNEESIKSLTSSALNTAEYTEPLQNLLEKLVILQETSEQILSQNRLLKENEKEAATLNNLIKTQEAIIKAAAAQRINPLTNEQFSGAFGITERQAPAITDFFNSILDKAGDKGLTGIDVEAIFDSNKKSDEFLAKIFDQNNIKNNENLVKLFEEKGLLDISGKFEDLAKNQKLISDAQVKLSNLEIQRAKIEETIGKPSVAGTGQTEGLVALATGIFAQREERLANIGKNTTSVPTVVNEQKQLLGTLEKIEKVLNNIDSESQTRDLATKAALEVSLRQQEAAKITGINIGDGGRLSGDPKNLSAFETLFNAPQSIGDLLSGNFTKLELLEELEKLESVLKDVGLSLQDENIKKYLSGEGIPEKYTGLENLSKTLIQLSIEGIKAGEILNDVFDDPFSSVNDQNQTLTNLSITLEKLEKEYGKTSEAVKTFNKNLKETTKIKLPENNIDKFLLGARTELEKINQELPTVAERGQEVARDLVDGFTNAFDKIVFEGEDFGDSIKQIFADILREQALLVAKQSFSNLFSGLFGVGQQGSNQSAGTSGGGILDIFGGLLGGGKSGGGLGDILSGVLGGGGSNGGALSSLSGGAGAAGLSAFSIPGLLKAGAQLSPLKALGITNGNSVFENLISGNFKEALPAPIGGLFKLFDIFHSGGDLVSNPKMSSLLGLKSNEVPFIGYEGERVVSRNQSQIQFQNQQNNIGNPIQLTIINVVEKDDLQTQLNSPEGSKAIINHISNNKKTTRRALEL